MLFALSEISYSGESNDWTRVEGEQNGMPISIRLRQKLPSEIDIEKFPYLVIVSWEYTPANESGFPVSEVVGLMGEVENSFSDSIESNAYLAATFLGNGIREWYVYAHDVAKLESDFNKATAKFNPLPIKIKASRDVGWRSYFRLLPDRQ